MKNNAKHLFFLSAILLLTSAFVKQPVPSTASRNSDEVNMYNPYGGVIVVFAGKTGGEISRQEMESQTEIKVDGCHKDARVFTFTLSITKSGKTSTLTANSSALSAEMRSKLKSLTKGDEFEFRNTKAYLANGKDVVEAHGRKFIVA